MARELFIDASAWIAVAHTQDNHHQTAKEIYPQLAQEYQRFVTTNLVLAEVHALLRRRLGHLLSMQFLDSMTGYKLDKVFETAELETQAIAILRQYDDQALSYADAVSFALMKQRRITDVFTYDQHFRVMGFQIIG